MSEEKKEITQTEIRESTGLCAYCQENPVRWFCPDCFWGICDYCLEDGTWDDRCQRCLGLAALPMLADINQFQA